MFRALPCVQPYWSVWFFMLVLCSGCATGSFFASRPPRIIPVEVTYLPYLVKGKRPVFPPTSVLVLRPVDQRAPYPMKKGNVLPASQDHIAILGIWGLNSEEGVIKVNSSQLGAQRRMKAGIAKDPDIARAIFTLPGLPNVVQHALATHLQEAGIPARMVDFSSPHDPAVRSLQAHYTLGCTIEEFSLVSLERHTEVAVETPFNTHFIYVPIRGPTRAEVSLALTLYRWPSGEVVWEGRTSDVVDDPPLGEHEFLYASPGEVLSMALSRAVGTLSLHESLQQVLLTARAS
ncbi:MAG: hypothetical protein NZ578_03630 [Candidatus Binatia bacterium]|nr:hypothetical protein [Candidatus Binatia bacterium]